MYMLKVQFSSLRYMCVTVNSMSILISG